MVTGPGAFLRALRCHPGLQWALEPSEPLSANLLYCSKGNHFHTIAECIYKTNLLRMRSHWIEYQNQIYSYSCMLCIIDAEVAISLSATVNFILPLDPKCNYVFHFTLPIDLKETNQVLSSLHVFRSWNDDIHFKLYYGQNNISPEYKNNAGISICLFRKLLLLSTSITRTAI